MFLDFVRSRFHAFDLEFQVDKKIEKKSRELISNHIAFCGGREYTKLTSRFFPEI